VQESQRTEADLPSSLQSKTVFDKTVEYLRRKASMFPVTGNFLFSAKASIGDLLISF
jgi:hypothetical protein